MRFDRSAGILLHPTSLPSEYGIGNLGPDAYRFIDFLGAAGQKLWQVLPLGPTGYGDSPYQCFSAFAGNPLLISPDKLVEEKLLSKDGLRPIPSFDPHKISYGDVIEYNMRLLRKAFARFREQKDSTAGEALDEFCRINKSWLDDFAFFMAIKSQHGGDNWSTWDKDLIHRKPGALKALQTKLSDEMLFHKFLQFHFFKQWKELKAYANTKGVKIVGDLPIFIAYDSADLWANKKLFSVDEDGNLLVVAGVPPDYFSPTGQHWGNPLFRWNEMEKDDFLWWRRRIAKLLELVDIIRIDHFRGFDAYWEIPGDAPTAEKGRWVKAPGRKFFITIEKHLGDLPIIAEDLGFITESVIKLRDQFGFPGMKILQFAFGSRMERKFLPHNLTQNCAVYTGSHDNDTTRGYFEKARNENSDVYTSAQQYLNYYGEDIRIELIRVAFASVANLVIIPMQDILNLGSDARMNFPGKSSGNWTWRFSWDQVSDDLAGIYKKMTILYERLPQRNTTVSRS